MLSATKALLANRVWPFNRYNGDAEINRMVEHLGERYQLSPDYQSQLRKNLVCKGGMLKFPVARTSNGFNLLRAALSGFFQLHRDAEALAIDRRALRTDWKYGTEIWRGGRRGLEKKILVVMRKGRDLDAVLEAVMREGFLLTSEVPGEMIPIDPAILRVGGGVEIRSRMRAVKAENFSLSELEYCAERREIVRQAHMLLTAHCEQQKFEECFLVESGAPAPLPALAALDRQLRELQHARERKRLVMEWQVHARSSPHVCREADIVFALADENGNIEIQDADWAAMNFGTVFADKSLCEKQKFLMKFNHATKFLKI